ncbi:hypothetical protein FOPG_06816 [Fusarium oxysporum f. sp. conglutinans race 2 54008]|uniref:Fungal N-terminal domain-containing protein n=1 Tax=Fusarium oxysporum f. sp. conglutinans race 2 54008 TaxID=1089457 RepID=X0HS54_FUSOX|nr:hypothetical protein FOPG_06816 [Fusarium oxysporum f. sp. conglutinans race 2 54008]KAG6981328.1 hypothetical protein FocnCong_v009179 [Fusarium oxysporum f. sp. conglutinans]KAI8414464.1 hypothetical protein FOFC_04075 [Fusarium oxysporum]
MAELALAIIPLGLKTCSGLMSYLGGLKDHDDAIARLKRLAESLEGSFRLLDGFLKSGQLDLSTSQAVAQTLRCLANCENALKNLKEFGAKLSVSKMPDPTVKDRVKGSYRKLAYPLRQDQLTQLENTLESLCTPLNLAVQSLQLEIQAATSNALTLNNTRLKQTSDDVSALTSDVFGLRDPLSSIETKLPSLQTSVAAIAPQISLMIQAQFKSQMDEIRHSFQQAESAARQRNAQTNEILSQLQIDHRNPVPAIYKLAAKPSALSTIASSVLACPCRARRLRTRKTLRFGPLYLVDETTTDISHYKDCEFGFVDPKYSRSRTLRLSSIVRVINKAVELTLRTTGGAGGFSISPSFTYFAEVDENRSPAFRVFDILMRNSFSTQWAMKNCPEPFFKSIIVKLKAIFNTGTAMPTDLGPQGCSLLHRLTLVMNCCGSRGFNFKQQQSAHTGLEQLFDFLITAGTPISAVDSECWMAWHIAANDLVLPMAIISRLHVEDIEVAPIASGVPSYRYLTRQDFIKYDNSNQKFVEGLFGPLTLAILRNDKEEARQLINNYPECLDEISFYGETPFHFAIENPEILENLVKKADPEQLVRSSKVFAGEITLLGRAIQVSADICHNQENNDGTFCPCTTAVELLLAAGCPIIPYRDFLEPMMLGQDWVTSLFICASNHCKVLLAKQLQSYRRELVHVAQKKLPRSEQTSVHVIELDRILRERGLLGFGRLSTALSRDLKRLPTRKQHSRSIYLDITDPEDAFIFWDLGFSDIDDHWADWAMTHENGPGFGKSFRNFLRTVTPTYAIWLYQHCPNLWSLVCEHRKPESPIFVLAEVILSHYLDHDIGYHNVIQYLVNSPIATEDTDDCICQCSHQGCTPFTHGLKFLGAAYHLRSSSLRLLVSEYGHMLSLSQHMAVLRQATFQELHMEHTCIDKPGHLADGPSESDFDPSAKDLEMETFLNELVMEYQAFLLRDADESPYETGECCDDYTLKVRSRRHSRAMLFWDFIWPSRVHDIEKKLASSWMPDREVLDDLGVSLWMEDDLEVSLWMENEEQMNRLRIPTEEDCRRWFREMMEKLEMIE